MRCCLYLKKSCVYKYVSETYILKVTASYYFLLHKILKILGKSLQKSATYSFMNTFLIDKNSLNWKILACNEAVLFCLVGVDFVNSNL